MMVESFMGIITLLWILYGIFQVCHIVDLTTIIFFNILSSQGDLFGRKQCQYVCVRVCVYTQKVHLHLCECGQGCFCDREVPVSFRLIRRTMAGQQWETEREADQAGFSRALDSDMPYFYCHIWIFPGIPLGSRQAMNLWVRSKWQWTPYTFRHIGHTVWSTVSSSLGRIR